MPKHIPIKGGHLIANDHRYFDGDYVDYLADLEYSKTPSTLIQYPHDPQEEADIAYYDELGKSLKDHGRGPIGKRVI